MNIDPAILRGQGVESVAEGPTARLPMEQVAAPPLDCSEETFQSAVIALATMNCYRHYHTRDSRRSPSGFPDLVLVKPGRRVIFAELKTETGKETQHQAEWRNDLLAAGSIACLWRPSDWPRIVEALTA